MNNWLYPMSVTSGYVLDPGQGAAPQPVSFEAYVDEYYRLLASGHNSVDWCCPYNIAKVATADRVFFYSCADNGDQGVCGLASVTWANIANERIGMDFHMDTTGRLIDCPFPGRELRPPITNLVRRKRAVVALDPLPEIITLLDHHINVLYHFGTRGWAS